MSDAHHRLTTDAKALVNETGDSGQAMVEYAIVAGAIALGAMVGSFVFLPEFIDALQRYYDGFYILLNLPIP